MTQIGTTYAQGLYALAQEESLTDEILSQLDVLEKTVGADQNYLKLLSTPALSKDERRELIDQAFRDKVHIYVLNFMKLLTEKGYIRHFSECCRAYRQLYNEEHGILPVRAVSAVAMSQQQLARLQEKLEQVSTPPEDTSRIEELENRVLTLEAERDSYAEQLAQAQQSLAAEEPKAQQPADREHKGQRRDRRRPENKVQGKPGEHKDNRQPKGERSDKPRPQQDKPKKDKPQQEAKPEGAQQTAKPEGERKRRHRGGRRNHRGGGSKPQAPKAE